MSGFHGWRAVDRCEGLRRRNGLVERHLGTGRSPPVALNRDVGFVTTYSGGDWNTTVVNTIGGHGLVYDGGAEFDTSIFGYPSNRDGGNVMWACWGTATDNSILDNKSKITCNFGGGSSGGPWTWNYDNASGLGSVRSVMSTVNSEGVNKGPHSDQAVVDAMNAANADW